MAIKFLFHGEAVAAGGFLSSPVLEVIPVQAASALPITGGTATARVDNFAHQGGSGTVLSFSAGYTQVLGYYIPEQGAWNTQVTATLENFNVLDVVTADKVVAHLASTHPEGADQPSIVVVGSHFENLRIAGHPVSVDLAVDVFDGHDTFAKITDGYRKDEGLRKILDQLSLPEFQGDRGAGGIVSRHGLIGCTLVRGISCPSPQIKLTNNAIEVPQFGTVHLAELFVSECERSLSMVRVELHTPPAGTVSGGGGKTNGKPCP